MITIKEMADIIGVSPTTVSNVIRGRTKEVSKEMIEKVEKVVKEYNYIPNMSAINLAKSNSNIISFVMNANVLVYENAIQDFFTNELIGRLERKIREHGYYLMIYMSDKIEEIIKFVSLWNVDGLIALGFNFEEATRLRQVYKKSLVFIDGYFLDDKIEYCNIGLEDYRGAYDMTKYLISCGHKNIAFFAYNIVGVDNERYKGFRDAIEASGLDMVPKCRFISEKNGIEAIRDNVKKFVKRMSEFSAIFCTSDNCAVVVIDTLLDLGYKIPEDISVTGYDDTIISSMIRPKLTTVHQSPTLKADKAIDKLLKLMSNPNEEIEHIILPVSLKIRDSVKLI